MKKVLSMVMSAIMVVAITLSLAGCNSTITVQDYIESDAFKTEIESVKEQFEGQGISVEVSAKDNALTYTYVLAQTLSEEDLALYKQSMEAASSTLDATLKQVYDEMVKAVSDDSSVSVTMEYKDASGAEIVSFTYPE